MGSTALSSASEPSSLLFRKVFAVLANSCGAIGEAALADLLSADSGNSGCDALKSKPFLSLLLSFLREAPLMPHEAFQAVRCLRSLLVSSKEVELAMDEMSAIDVVSSACEAGVEFRHEALGRECVELMAASEGMLNFFEKEDRTDGRAQSGSAVSFYTLSLRTNGHTNTYILLHIEPSSIIIRTFDRKKMISFKFCSYELHKY